jgi:hypothetical protein
MFDHDLSTTALWQLPADRPSSEAAETWQKIVVNFAYKVPVFTLVWFFNMP